ncbi:MAG: hypothetical protein RBT63_01620 [Bdellovibrionales bacterium]|nr:hypothetical protein [Bdellovibrionales bacterium]
MNTVHKLLKRLFVLLVLVGVGFILVTYYSYIFSRTVVGRIDNVARVTGVTAMIGGARSLTESQLHLFSVSIRQPNGEMITAISEDGQWAIAKSGLCVKAKYYPYPPWNLKRAGTYFNARLLTMADCGSEAARELGITANAFDGVPLEPSQAPVDQGVIQAPPTASPVPPPGTIE